MTEEELIKQVCREGIASVKKYEKGANRRGGIRGFELARTADDIASIKALLIGSEAKDAEFRQLFQDNEIDANAYWEQRYVTLQLEHVFKVLQVAHPDKYPAPFASGIRQYAKIVGVEE